MATANRIGKGLQKLFVGNLPWTVGHPELRAYFKEFGRVVAANVVFDKKTGCSRGYGFIVFNDITSIERIESEQKHVLDGNYLKIQKA